MPDPELPASPTTLPVEPTGQEQAPAGAAPPDQPAGSDSVPGGVAQGAPGEVPPPVAPRPEPPEWALKRIDEQTRKLREAETREAALKVELEAARAGKPGLPAAEITRQATELAAQQAFEADCTRVASSGKAAYSDFDTVMGNFHRIGGTNPVFLQGVMEQGDDAARVIYELGKDLGEASRIMALSPVRQAAAITRYAMRSAPASAPAPAPVSSTAPVAPAGTPVSVALPGVVGTGRGQPGGTRLDDPRTSMEAWMAERNKSAWDRPKRKSA